MAKDLKKVVNQYNINDIPERIIIQWEDDVTGEPDQVIINYADMDAAQKATFDNYKNLVEQLMT